MAFVKNNGDSMDYHMEMEFTGLWKCLPEDWQEVNEIEIFFGNDTMRVTYSHKHGKRESEQYNYKVLYQQDGLITLEGAPFSILQLRAAKRLIVSRLRDGKRRPYTYVFKPVNSKPDQPSKPGGRWEAFSNA